MTRTIFLALVAGLILSVGFTGFASAKCAGSVKKAQSFSLEVSRKVIKMKRLHQARKMISKAEASKLDRELKALKTTVGQANSLCKAKKDQAATTKAKQAMAMAKALDVQHMSMMKASMAHSGQMKGQMKGQPADHSMKMKQ